MIPRPGGVQTALEPNAIGIGLLLQHGVKIRPEAGGHFRGAARRAVAVHTATQREADLTIAAIAAETGLSRYLVRALLIEQGVIKRPQHRSAR